MRQTLQPCSRRLEIMGLFCKKALCKRRYSAKETYHFKEPTLLIVATPYMRLTLQLSVEKCNTHIEMHTMHRTATHCTALQHAALLCNTMHRTANTMHCTAKQYIALQHNAPHCNTLQHTVNTTTLIELVLQCVCVCVYCSMLQCVVVCCSVL